MKLIKSASMTMSLSIALSGCMAGQKVQQNLNFSAKDASFALQKGTAKITGSAFLRQRGGGVVTAAGQEVSLVPVTPYSTERINIIYRGAKFAMINHDVPSGSDPEYFRFSRNTKADAQGNFEFTNVAAGSYYVNTSVIWQAGDFMQGGNLNELVTVKPGQSVKVILSGD